MDEVGEPLPTGVVTLVMGDLEGSVGLWEHDGRAMTAAMTRVDDLVDQVTLRFCGVRPAEQGEGDNFVLAFQRVSDAIAGACELQRRLTTERWPHELGLRFRIGAHSGEATLDATNRYEGQTINRCARIRDLAHGGQTLLSAATAALAAEVLPDGATCRSLGTYALRGLAHPEVIHQLCHPDLADDFGPIASSGTTSLPTPVSSFVGRSSEVVELNDLIEGSRVVTVTGAGGSGKSRLALEVARVQLATRPAWLVELAPIQDPVLVTRSVADTMGVELAGGTPPIDAIIRAVLDRPVLLVIDNCEHLLDVCADLTSTLTKACPSLSVLATSREPLSVEGEVTWRTPSLSAPDALTLFVDRAGRVATGFDLTDANTPAVEDLCRRVDRLPLAIELAAARCRTLTIDQIAGGLRERFRLLTGGSRDALPRQRSLEASVAWSYGLLSQTERLVLARLSVFAGLFNLESATAVAADGPVTPDQVLDHITRLVDRSLIQVEPAEEQARYRLLETIRIYARERLAELDDPDHVRDRHLDHALRFATTAGAGYAVDTVRWDPILRTEQANLRAAIDWAVGSGRPDDVIDLAESLSGFWQARSMQDEIDRTLRSAMHSHAASPSARARGLTVAARMAAMGGDMSTAFDFACDSYELAQTLGDADLEATAAAMRAWMGMASGRGTNDQIAADIETAMAAVDRFDPGTAASVLIMLGSTQHLWSAGLDVGRVSLERALAVAPEDGFDAKLFATFNLLNLGWDGRVDTFRDTARWAIDTTRELGADFFLSWSLMLVGFFEGLYGHEQRARQPMDEALEVGRRAGTLVEYFALRADAFIEVRFGCPSTALTKALDIGERSSEMRLGMNERIDQWLVGTAARRAGDADLARLHLDTVLARTADPFLPQVAGRAHLDLTLLDLDDGDVDAAWQHAHDALEVFADSGDRTGILDALDLIAVVAASSNTAKTAARLLGAADALREELDVAPFTLSPERRQEIDLTLGSQLDDAETLRADGARLSFEEVVAYARRGRGDRNRPTSGWASLTPTELRVVDLVAAGLMNAQIAEQLLISVNTVKAHLSHAYAKLGISSRTQLASEATARLR